MLNATPKRGICMFASTSKAFTSSATSTRENAYQQLEPVVKLRRPNELGAAAAGRMLMGKTITIFGGSGLLGQAVVKELTRYGPMLITPYRGDPYYYKHLKPMGDLNQVLFMPYHVKNEGGLYKALRNSHIAVNLVGCFGDTQEFPLTELHVETAGRIARKCSQLGIQKLIHVSALNCHESPTPYMLPKGSEFLRTKALGEKEVLREFPTAVIFRPSFMWGQRDDFLFYFTNRWRYHQWLGKVYYPFWEKGKKTVKQPVCAADVARGILHAIQDEQCESKIFQAVGPHRYQMDALIAWFFMHLRRKVLKFEFVEMTNFLKLKTRYHQAVYPVYPKITLEKLEFECQTDQVDPQLPTLEDLDVNPIQLEDVISWELKPRRRYGLYWDPQGEFPEPPFPPLARE